MRDCSHGPYAGASLCPDILRHYALRPSTILPCILFAVPSATQTRLAGGQWLSHYPPRVFQSGFISVPWQLAYPILLVNTASQLGSGLWKPGMKSIFDYHVITPLKRWLELQLPHVPLFCNHDIHQGWWTPGCVHNVCKNLALSCGHRSDPFLCVLQDHRQLALLFIIKNWGTKHAGNFDSLRFWPPTRNAAQLTIPSARFNPRFQVLCTCSNEDEHLHAGNFGFLSCPHSLNLSDTTRGA